MRYDIMSDFDEQLKNFDEEKFKEVAKRHGLEVTFHSDRAGFYNAETDTFTPIEEAEEEFFNYMQGKPTKKKSDKSTLALIIKAIHRLMGKLKHLCTEHDLSFLFSIFLMPIFMFLVIGDFLTFAASILSLSDGKFLEAFLFLLATCCILLIVFLLSCFLFDE